MMSDIIYLFRVKHWYKNLLIFIALIFSNNLFNLNKFILVLIGFFLLNFISSSSYVVNDLFDLDRDKKNPEKRKRPLASNKIKKSTAFSTSIFLLIIGLGLSYHLNIRFFYINIIFYVNSLLYTKWFKHIPYFEFGIISLNYILRAIAGALLINVYISKWLIFGTLIMALMLAISKRYGELGYLKNSSTSFRPVLKYYNRKTLKIFIVSLLLVLTCSYVLFVTFSSHPKMYFSIPIFLFLIIRYFYLLSVNSPIIRNPENFYQDKLLVTTMVIYSVFVIVLIYY